MEESGSVKGSQEGMCRVKENRMKEIQEKGLFQEITEEEKVGEIK